MDDDHVDIFHLFVGVALNYDGKLREFCQLATPLSYQADGHGSMAVGILDRPNYIGGVSAGGDSDYQVPLLQIVSQRFDKRYYS